MYVIGENQKLKKEIFGFCDTFTSEPLSAVFNASWSPCNEYIITAHEDGSLKLW